MVKFWTNLFVSVLVVQLCNGQIAVDCANAVPICSNTPINGGAVGFGSDDFNGASSTGCLERTTSGAIESNSAWYRFRTMASGQLGFNIGHDSTEDWDFALYQASDCNNLGNPIRCNFFDNSDGVSFIGVGEDPTGNNGSVQYEDWLTVGPGEDYFLLLNNFSASSSGFSIQFTGEVFVTNPGTALDCSIVSNLLGPPISACIGDTVPLDATTTGATYEWYADTGSGFTLLSGMTAPTLSVTTNAVYRVVVTISGSTLVSDVQVALTEIPVTMPLSDEIQCHTTDMIFDLSVKDDEALGAQDPDAFIVSYHGSQTDADLGINPFPKSYPKSAGQETIYVRTTSLANPDCFDTSESFVLDAIETPQPNFEEEVTICENTTGIVIGETIPNPSHTYSWSTGETTSSIMVSNEGDYTLTITNTYNGVTCGVDRTVSVLNSVLPSISDIDIEDFQSSNTVTIHTDIDGNFEYRLDSGDYQSSPVFQQVSAGTHMVSMRDVFGCGEIMEEIVIVGFSASFSPNGDVLNERWHIDGLSVLNSPVVTIYDRHGKLITELTEFSLGWDGNFNGKPLPSTDYWFKLSYIGSNGNRTQAKYLKNHFSLRR